MLIVLVWTSFANNWYESKSLAIGDHKPIPLATKRIDAEQYEVNDPYSGDKTNGNE